MERKTFTGFELNKMNGLYPWNNSIKNTDNIKTSTDQFKLVSTGDCNLHNGRQMWHFLRIMSLHKVIFKNIIYGHKVTSF